MATLTASAGSVSYSNPGMLVPENFEAVLAAGLDDVYKDEFSRPQEGMKFFKTYNMKKRTENFQTYWGLGAVAQNRDSEKLPVDEMGLGFDWSLTSNIFRGGIAIERQLIEDELYGVIKDRQMELVQSEKLSEELVMADVFNRALGTSGAPVLAQDGMYFIDSARPKAYQAAGTWSNLGDTSAITANQLFAQELAFRNMTDERGQIAPITDRMTLVIPKSAVVGVWELLKSDLRPADSMNSKNYWNGRFDYVVYDMLTSDVVFYMAGSASSPKNKLYFGTRSAPQLETWKENGNDVFYQRIRSRFGVGLGAPYIWRGHALA